MEWDPIRIDGSHECDFSVNFVQVDLFWGDLRCLSDGWRNRVGCGLFMVGFPSTKWLEQTKVSCPGLKNSSPCLIFFLQISNFFESLGNRCQIRSPSTWRRLTHKWRYLLSLSQSRAQQQSCLPITEWKNNYKVIQSLDFCILWGYFKSKLWQDLTVCKFVYIYATSHLSRVSAHGWVIQTNKS